MKWFKHSSSLRNDPKVKRLIRKYGSDGYAIYVSIVEMIADSLDPISKIIPFLEEDIMDIAIEFNIDSSRVNEVLDFCIDQGLLHENTNGMIFCFKLYSYVDEYFTKNQKNKEQFIKRNRAIITAYKEGGIESMLLSVQELNGQPQHLIGQIKITAPEQLQSNSRVRRDKLSQEEIRVDKIRGESNTPYNPQNRNGSPFEPYRSSEYDN